jgi:hypothetical protein
MAPPAAAPGKPGLKPKGKLPPWVWIVALGGGLLVGFFLLKKSPSQGEGEGGEESGATGQQRSSGGASVVAPLDEMTQALGLTPPSSSGGFNLGNGGGESGSGESAGSESTNTYSGLGSSPDSTAPYYGDVATLPSTPPPTSTPAPAPPAAPRGGSSSAFKAQ